ncbi:MAG: FAD-dependent oxidoreductase [Pseudomonadota bacterium]
MSDTENLVIIGAGHAAGQLVASLKQHSYPGHITLVGEEASLPYQRPPLSKKFLAGQLDADRLLVKPAPFYEHVTTKLGVTAERIDGSSRQVLLDTGETLPFDKLVLSLGSQPRRLPLPGGELSGIAYLRSIADVQAIRDSLEGGRRVAIVGAGYIGLETAAVLQGMGFDVTVIEAMDRVMSRVVSPAVSAFYERLHRNHGVNLLLGTGIESFTGANRVDGVRLADGTEMPADTVIVGVGVSPNVALAEQLGLDIDDGIVVDSRCRTSLPGVFAIGDCTNHPNPVYNRNLRLESVQNALEQAKTAAANLCGVAAEYGEVPWFWSDQYDVKLQIAGLSSGHDQTIVRGDPDNGAFACLYLREGVLIALDAVNSPRDFMQAKPLIANQAQLDGQLAADPERPLKETLRPEG